MTPSDEQQRLEYELRNFLKDLLRTQQYDFIKDEDQFSQRKQSEILGRLCNLIARNLRGASCTIHLQMYDPKSWQADQLCEKRDLKPGKFDQQLDKLIEACHRTHRRKVWKSALTFPYWEFPKGAAILVAHNARSPWANVRPKDPRRRAPESEGVSWRDGVTVLDQGLTKEIVQGNIPRVCDRRVIRPERSFKKLGKADMFVWTNESWERMFRNYYGVPIQIHHSGEAIGLLKVENKKCDHIELPKDRLSSTTANNLRENLRKRVGAAGVSAETKQSQVSIFEIAYLTRDLRSIDLDRDGLTSIDTLKDVLFIPYPTALPILKRKLQVTRGDGKQSDSILDQDRLSDQYRTLIPPADKRPPLQFLFKDHETEQALVGLIGEERAIDFYDGLCDRLNCDGTDPEQGAASSPERDRSKIAATIEEYIDSFVGGSEEVAKCNQQPPGVVWAASRAQMKRGGEMPDFCFEVRIDASKGESTEGAAGAKATFFVIVPPSPNEAFNVDDPILAERTDDFRHVNAMFRDAGRDEWNAWVDKWLEGKKDPAAGDDGKGYKISRSGEYVYAEHSDRPTGGAFTSRVTDLLIDRLAARTHAFVESQRVDEFSQTDAHKLSWAAFEIGKLIERMISYRASHSPDDPMPLTAMEFYRLPISNLSFVDDLRERRQRSRRIKGYLDYHLQRVIEGLRMHKETEYTSRIKEYRSFLARLGERFDGYRRGNLGIWLYLLAGELAKAPGCQRRLEMKMEQIQTHVDELENSADRTETEEVQLDELREELKQLKDGHEFLSNLSQFQGRVDSCIKVMDLQLDYTDGLGEAGELFQSHLLTDIVKQIHELRPVKPLLDLKFDSPPFQYVVDGPAISGADSDRHGERPTSEGNTHEEVAGRAEAVDGAIEETEPPQVNSKADVDGAWRDVLRRAIQRVLWNLSKESLLDDAAVTQLARCARPSGDFKSSSDVRKQALSDLFSGSDPQTAASLVELVLRNYDSFAQAGVSLLLQLLNLLRFAELDRQKARKDDDARADSEGHGGESADSAAFEQPGCCKTAFFHIYTACCRLRDVLATSARQIEDEPPSAPLKHVFGGEDSSDALSLWKKLEAFIEDNRTSGFMKLFQADANSGLGDVECDLGQRDDLRMSPLGIYKRLRTLVNVLRHQRSAASLDWELGRFDLLGGRINCLFKGQVFLVYERVWNNGEPFFRSSNTATSADTFTQSLSRMLTSRSRMRWLCVRSKVLEGEYNALQIGGFMEPESFQPGHWDAAGLNLNRLRIILNRLLAQFDPNWFCYYRHFGFHRYQMARVYEDWNRIAAHVRSDTPEVDEDLRRTAGRVLWHGLFLYEGVVDILLFLLEPAKPTSDDTDRYLGAGPPLVPVEIDVDLLNRINQHIGRISDVDLNIPGRIKKYVNRFHAGLLKLSDLHSRDGDWPDWYTKDSEIYQIGHQLLEEIENEVNIQVDSGQLPQEQESRVRSLLDRIRQNLRYEEDLWLDSANLINLYQEALSVSGLETLKGRSDAAIQSLLSRLQTKERSEYPSKERKQTYELLDQLNQQLNEAAEDATTPRDALDNAQKIFGRLQAKIDHEEEHWLSQEDGDIVRKRRVSVPVLYLRDFNKRLSGLQQRLGLVVNLLQLGVHSVEKQQIFDVVELLSIRLKELRRSQKSYLMEEMKPFNPVAQSPPAKPGDHEDKWSQTSSRVGGLWMRSQDQVLNRIKNLIFLYHPRDFVKLPASRNPCRPMEGQLSLSPPPWALDNQAIGPDDEATESDAATFLAIRAYDLFYYLRDLVPVEIQIRTKLADTVADQYHDAVYKGKPPVGTEIERVKLEEMGKLVDDIDRELEIDYEDYVTKYWFDLLERDRDSDLGDDDSLDTMETSDEPPITPGGGSRTAAEEGQEEDGRDEHEQDESSPEDDSREGNQEEGSQEE